MHKSSHIEICLEVRNEVERILSLHNEDGYTNVETICYLSSILQNQSSGSPGAGLKGGQQQESLWVDFLTSSSELFQRFSDLRVLDADYYFEGYPISHKTIGWKGSGQLALSWSKNPPDGIQRTEFLASMAIAFTKKPPKTKRSKWYGLPHGWYIIPLDYLKDNVKLSANNKTNSLIESNYVLEALHQAIDNQLFVHLPYDHSEGEDWYLSYWFAGRKSVIKRPF